jgi:hypothetical protein
LGYILGDFLATTFGHPAWPAGGGPGREESGSKKMKRTVKLIISWRRWLFNFFVRAKKI